MKQNGVIKHVYWAAILLGGIACWVFFQFWYPCHFFFQEQNQLFLWSWEYIGSFYCKIGGLARLCGDFLTQFYYYLYAGAAILALCLTVTSLLTYKALHRLTGNRLVALVAALLLMAFMAVCHFSTSYRLSSTMTFMGWVFLLWAASWLGTLKNKRTYAGLLLLAPVGYVLFGVPQVKTLKAPDFILEQDFAVDSEYRFGHYNRVLAMVESSTQRTDEMLFFYNLVQAQRGELPDHLLQFIPNQLGTFYKIGPETPRLTITNMNELYWALGDMTFTERAAMMANVFAPENRNVRMIKRLAECAIVSKDTVASQKFLRLLENTFVYRQWARDARKGLFSEKDGHIYAAKMQLVPKHDTITISDNAHFLMVQLLDHNPSNRIALDYMLCSDLLLKDIESFKRDYDRYVANDERDERDALIHRFKTTRLYQEALCIWLAGTHAPQEDWEKYMVRDDVMRQFTEYGKQRGHTRFKGTYWYYFDKQKAPEI